jgi:transposase
MSTTAWIGIDVSKYSFHAAIADESAEPRQWASLPVADFEHSAQGMRQFADWLRGLGWTKRRVSGVCIEATGRYSRQWKKLLGQRLERVCIVNPAHPKAYGSCLGIRDKSDRVDACIIALFANSTHPEPTPEESPTQRELRELSRLCHSLAQQCQANQQRLADGPSCTCVRATLKKTIAALQRQIKHLEQAMNKLIHSELTLRTDFERAKTVKGIGSKTATVILAEFGDLRRYNRDQLVALAGLYPREHTSGTSVHKKSRLAKAGKTPVRAALYMGAMSALRVEPNLKRFAQRLETNGKCPMQVIAAVMRKLLLLVHAVIVSETDYDPQFQQRLQYKPT